MKIVRDDPRPNLQDSLKMGDSLFEETVTVKVLEIADVLAKEGLRTSNDTDRIFQFATDGQDGL